jgi:tetratricopeptide (TPR) repeat protein
MLEEALGLYKEASGALKKLAEANPGSAQAQRDVSVSLNKLGDVLREGRKLEEAQGVYEESLTIRRKLAQANPESAEAQRDVSVSLTNLADMLREGSKLEEARGRYEESLSIDKRLAEANPSSAQAQRDLVLSYGKLALLTGERHLWVAALNVAEEMQRSGKLAAPDQRLLDILREGARTATKP